MINLVLLPFNILLVSWLAWRYYLRQSPENRGGYWAALIIKVLGGVALGLVYFYHYGVGDTLSFWQDGAHLADLFWESPARVLTFIWDDSSAPEIIDALQQQTPRSIFFVKICGPLALISGGNYWVMATWLSLASFAGTWFLYIRSAQLYPEIKSAAAVAFLFVPSVVFWSSGLIKESLGLAALFILIASCLSLMEGKRISPGEWALTFVALWVGWNLKYYWVGIFLPAVLPAVLVALITRWNARLSRYDGLLWFVFFAAFLLVATNVHPNFYASRFLEVIYHNNLEFTRMSEPPRIVQYLNLEPETASVLLNAPAALIAGLFRPFVWESFNVLSALASAENLGVLILVIQALYALRSMLRSTHRVLIVSATVYVLLLITFLALSTPNFGTLSRYRIGALPVLILLCLLPATPAGKWLSARRWFG